MRRLFDSVGAWLPRGYTDVFRQIGFFVLADLIYELIRGLAEGNRGIAFANGQSIIDFEQMTHTLLEPNLQSIFLPTQWVIDVANFLYMNSHFVLTTSFLVWLYLWRNDSFYFVRNMFMVAMALAIVGYTLYPAAPPRLFPQYGYIDTIAQFAEVNHDSALVKIFVNPYAAVPSMHCAFALLVGVSAFRLSRHTWTKAFWACYPPLVFWVVMVTGNHFWFDVVAGALVAGLSALTAQRLLARVRPEIWSWRNAPRRARA